MACFMQAPSFLPVLHIQFYYEIHTLNRWYNFTIRYVEKQDKGISRCFFLWAKCCSSTEASRRLEISCIYLLLCHRRNIALRLRSKNLGHWEVCCLPTVIGMSFLVEIYHKPLIPLLSTKHLNSFTTKSFEIQIMHE